MPFSNAWAIEFSPIINFRERETRDRVRITRVDWPYHACQISVNRDECCCQCQPMVDIFCMLSGKWWLPWSRRSSRRWSSSALVASSLALHRRVLSRVWDIFNKIYFSPALCALAVVSCSQLLFCICYRKLESLCPNMRNYSFPVVFFFCTSWTSVSIIFGVAMIGISRKHVVTRIRTGTMEIRRMYRSIICFKCIVKIKNHLLEKISGEH